MHGSGVPSIRGATLAFTVCVVAVMTSPGLVFSSDHIDGEVTKAEPLADLSDFYAFPSRGGASLSLILNTYPIAHSGAHFSSRISYAFELRNLSLSGGSFETGEALRIECSFTDEHDSAHSVSCKAGNGLTADALEDQIPEPSPMRVFFGRRSDPFFFNADWATATSTEGAIAVSDGENTMASLNALSLSVQIDRSLLPRDGMLALAVEAFTDGDGQPRYLDRIGRPEITNVTLIHRDGAEDIRDAVNTHPAFDVESSALAKVEKRLGEAIRYYDDLDGQQDWSDVQAAALVDVLKQDYLIVDPSKPCDGDAFFAIERAVLNGAEHESCGGRKPTDDIIDRLYTLYIANDRVVVRDDVDAPFKPISSEFPHLAVPETGIWSWFKTWLGNRRAR